MTDQDRFDQRLAERLRASEDRTRGGVAPQPPRGDRRGWAPFALVGAAGLVAGVLLVSVLLQRPGPPTGGETAAPSASASALSTVASPTPSSVPSASPVPTSTAMPSAPSSGEWAAGTIEVPDADGRGPYFSGLRWFPGIGWLAFGQDRSGAASDGPPAFWLSADGLSWTRAVVPSGLDGYAVRDVEVAALARGPRIVAVAHDYQHSAILVSSDGVTWQLADIPTAPANLNAVAYGDVGFVAVGTDHEWVGADAVSGVVWRSADGLTWSAATPAELAGAVPVTLEAIAGGGYLALGRLDNEAPPRTLGWTSPDGIAWQTNVIRPAQDAGGSLDLVSDSDASLVVFAGIDPDAYAAISTGGAAWSFESVPVAYADPTGIDISPQAIVMTAFLYVADGQSQSFVWVRDGPGPTWRSVDWQSRVPNADDFAGATGVAIGPANTLILFGNGRVLMTDGPLP